MARRFSPLALILACAALAAPAAAVAQDDFHAASAPSNEPATAEEALHRAQELLRGDGVKTGRELTPVLSILANKLPELRGAERRRAAQLLARPTDGPGSPDDPGYSVPEAPPVCGAHFCIHYVPATADAPPMTDNNANGRPDYVEIMLGEYEHVYDVENNGFGWRPARPDGTVGGNSLTDVYIQNIGPQGAYGFAAPDPGQRDPANPELAAHEQFGYLVMDNDYAEEAFTSKYGGNFVAPIQVTAAHEYNHVLQFGYDVFQDSWLKEATATWMEDKVYDEINDYRNYLNGWVQLSTLPLTTFVPQGLENSKVYGDAVFNRWIDERLGRDTIRRIWEVSIETEDFAPGAIDKALRERGTNVFDVFTAFATDTSEWRSNGAFEEGETFPDMERVTDLEPQTSGSRDFIRGSLDHGAFALVDVKPNGQNTITAGGTFPRGVAGAIALVGRDPGTGAAVTQIKRVPKGGPGTVKLTNASGFARVTAVVVNGEFTPTAFNEGLGDYIFAGDNALISLALNDFTKPKLSKVKAGKTVQLTFNEPVSGISTSTVKLVGPGNKSNRVRISQSGNGRTVVLRPSKKLSRRRRYSVKLSTAITDPGANKLPSSSRTKRFTAR